jgi:hypothetical protein
MTIFFEFACEAVVCLVFEKTVQPAVGCVAAEVGTPVWSSGCYGGGYWRFDWDYCGGRSNGCVRAIISCATGGGGAVATVLVGVAVVATEEGKVFGVVGFVAPFSTRDIEHAGGVYDVVADADDGGFTRSVIAGSS